MLRYDAEDVLALRLMKLAAARVEVATV